MRQILLAIAALHLIGWGLLAILGGDAVMLGTGLVAYLLGLRHAFDADHLVAIDATTRKLIHEHKHSHGVGFFFSLGHSTVVFAATALAVAGIGTVGQELLNGDSGLKQLGGLIGGGVAVAFLYYLGISNLIVLAKSISGEHAHPHSLFSKLLKPVSKPSQMYPVGLLFGLGLDTATSVTMLSLSIVSVASGQIAFAALALPIIFTAGMSLGDTLSGYAMSKSMQWATANSKRQAYNLIITGIAAIASLYMATSILLEL